MRRLFGGPRRLSSECGGLSLLNQTERLRAACAMHLQTLYEASSPTIRLLPPTNAVPLDTMISAPYSLLQRSQLYYAEQLAIR